MTETPTTSYVVFRARDSMENLIIQGKTVENKRKRRYVVKSLNGPNEDLVIRGSDEFFRQSWQT